MLIADFFRYFFSITALIVGALCTFFLWIIYTQKPTKAVRLITITIFIYTLSVLDNVISATVFYLETGFASQQVGFSIGDAVAYILMAFANIGLLFFSQNVYQLRSNRSLIILSSMELLCAIMISLFTIIESVLLPFLMIHVIFSIYISAIFSRNAFRTRKNAFFDKNKDAILRKTLFFFGLSGIFLTLTVIIFLLGEIFELVKISIQISSIGWICASGAFICFYLAYISPEIRSHESVITQIQNITITIQNLQGQLIEKSIFESELKTQLNELKTMDRFKNSFLDRFSHDLRTPLNAIIGFSDLLLQGQIGELDPAQTDVVRDIHGNGKQLLHMVEDIFNMVISETEQLVISPSSFDLDILLRELKTLSDFKAKQTSVSLNFNTELHGFQIWGDEKKIEHALLQVIEYGIHRTQAGTTMEMKISKLKENIIFQITDHGEFIPAEIIPILFDPLQKISPNKTETSIGLYYAKKIADLHNGMFEILSTNDIGTKYILMIPISQKK